MMHQLPELPFDMNALEPHISKETLEYHWGKHHATYVNNLNNLVKGNEFEDMDLEKIIQKADGGIFNNAAQIFNHSFYWQCLSPNGGGAPSGAVAGAIDQSFGSFSQFKDSFSQKAATLFGSGWVWLVKNQDGSLTIQQSPNAACPLTDGTIPLLTCDVWEHAYYIDYRNARPKYVEGFWNLVNWDFVNRNM